MQLRFYIPSEGTRPQIDPNNRFNIQQPKTTAHPRVIPSCLPNQNRQLNNIQIASSRAVSRTFQNSERGVGEQKVKLIMFGTMCLFSVLFRRFESTQCNFVAPCFDASCQQRFNIQKLLVIDPTNPYKGPFLSQFLFPSCCVCYAPSGKPMSMLSNTKTDYGDRR